MCPAWLYHSGISMHFLCIPIPMHQVALGYSHIIRSKSYGIIIAYGIILSWELGLGGGTPCSCCTASPEISAPPPLRYWRDLWTQRISNFMSFQAVSQDRYRAALTPFLKYMAMNCWAAVPVHLERYGFDPQVKTLPRVRVWPRHRWQKAFDLYQCK